MALEKHAKEAILKQITEQMEKQDGIITQAEVMELIEPHYIFDPQQARERAIREKANSLIAQFKSKHIRKEA